MPTNFKITRLCERPACGKPFTFRYRPDRPDQRFCGHSCSRIGFRMVFTEPLGDRFLARIDRASGHGPWGNCHLWTDRTRSGYGVFTVVKGHKDARNRMSRGLEVLAHHLSCIIHHGPAPDGKPNACHRCDNPPCVNGEHLFWGSASDNSRDMHIKGRARTARPGENHHNARLTPVQALDLRRRGIAGESEYVLSAEFGVSRWHAHNIIVGIRWSHL